jgi:putative tricarboxylic transport membrane protein
MLNNKDLMSGFLFFILGLFLGFKSMQHPIWSSFGPDEGFFPFTIAILIIALSLALIIKSFISNRHQKKEELLEKKEIKSVNIFRVSSYAAMMTLVGFLIESIGFLVSSTLFMIIILKYVEGKSWKITILVGFGTIIVSYLIFVYFLRVPLPKGYIIWS